MAYREDVKLCESDSCQVVLRNGEKVMGDMRLFIRYATPKAIQGAGPLYTWVLVRKTKDPKVRAMTWNSQGCFSVHSHVVSAFDIVDFAIGYPPKVDEPKGY